MKNWGSNYITSQSHRTIISRIKKDSIDLRSEKMYWLNNMDAQKEKQNINGVTSTITLDYMTVAHYVMN